MGTISDKLMRIINTKEDIRKALISKGYDVPTSIPFKEYAKMILDLPCKVDSFPDIEGIVARYYASGFTNEQMAANPVWVDKTGNGHDIQLKNFSWKGMSGVGGYKFNFKNSSEWNISVVQMKEHNDNRIVINNRLNAVQLSYKGTSIKIVIKLTGVEENNSRLKIYDDIDSSKEQSYNKDGIYEIDYITNDGANYVYFYITGGNYGELDLPITIEQLPLYPGALVFDGVDDYGTCDNFPILNKEKGYTVVALRQWINNSTNAAYLLSNAINNTTLGAFMFERNKDSRTYSFGRTTKISVNYNNPITYQTSNSYNSVEITAGTLLEGTDVLLVGANYKTITNLYANAAIWELVFLDHDATEEELTKIKDYFVKTYPWLFPDQAWIMVGKTNEDEDRATIANITGNGNDLVLSNFGFAEGSGYGLYYQYFGNEFKATNGEIEGGGWNIIDNYNISHDKRIPINSVGKCLWGNKALVNGIKLRFKLTGMTEGDVLAFGYAARYDLTYTSDGIYAIDFPPVDKPYGFSLQSSLTENLPTTPVTIKLLPFEYEGYLVTDGVDDKAVSKQFKFGENFTVILDFKFPVKKISYCGFDLSSKVRIQNLQGSGVYVVLKGNKTLIPSNVVRAVTSEGKVYDENWNEYNIVPGNISSNYTMVNLGFDGSNQFAESATKLAGIYSSILSKDECIKAYNYLQTLKSK